jgi:hypothetical protein
MNADPVSQRREGPGTGGHQVGASARVLDDHGVGLELGALPAGECLELLVSRAFWGWGQAPEAHRDCGGGAEVTHGAVAILRDRGITCGGRAQRGVSGMTVRSQASALGLVEAAR